MKTILITGASRGIGAATALLAARQGYAVSINYHKNRSAAEAVAEQIIHNGGRAVAIHADITREPDILRLFSETERQLGTIYALVNNAGILEQQMRLEHLTMERMERIVKANLLGPMCCAREAVKRMSTKYGGRGGVIVNVSSIAAKTGSPNEYIDYAASKGGLDTFTVGLSKEVAAEGIRVNAVRPSLIYTDIHTDGGEAGRVDRIKERVPMRRGGHATEVAEAILWLISEKSSYTTGSFIDVSGGI
ncbi:SDR family oxidoreductase [Parapedobacter lycopersici]|uniref:SDR family oxidoreductase n=1 Tax=Parapedobacter lycopersici TaxID=1864939 RepID=UPI0033415479